VKVAKRLAFGLLLLCATACERRTEGPNVVLITLDTTRADRLGAMGYAPAKTPVLDSLAARGVVFERAYASTPITLPSHTTILTGFDPNRHGVHDNGRFVVPESTETVAERLAAKGYETAAFVSAAVLDSLYGLNQGFQVYEDRTPRPRNPLVLAVPRRPGNEVTDAALSWLAKPRRAPFFLWAHYYDVHEPRRPPVPFKEIDNRYDGAIAYVDSEIGRLLAGVENAEAARETVIVVVADHGESLGQHGEVTHGVVAYDSTLHVPLIVSGPGFAKGNAVESLRLHRRRDADDSRGRRGSRGGERRRSSSANRARVGERGGARLVLRDLPSRLRPGLVADRRRAKRQMEIHGGAGAARAL
jgi:membrane-anchored protein YejM (alkaline phosphatase superfamily)